MAEESNKQDAEQEFRKLTPEENAKWEKAFIKGASTQGRAKLERYFYALMKTEDFQKTVQDLRKRYGFPEGGYKEGITYNLGNWAERKELLRKLDKELESVCRKYGLHFLYWGELPRTTMTKNWKS